eukprot:2373462-Prymnesium_polylepis.3
MRCAVRKAILAGATRSSGCRTCTWHATYGLIKKTRPLKDTWSRGRGGGDSGGSDGDSGGGGGDGGSGPGGVASGPGGGGFASDGFGGGGEGGTPCGGAVAGRGAQADVFHVLRQRGG